jgi:hypothetical protein
VTEGRRQLRIIIAALAIVVSVPLGSAAPASLKSFTPCGDYPDRATYGVRAEGVGCSKARKVAFKWYRVAVDEDFPRVVRFKNWRCTSSPYPDGLDVKCKREADEVRFSVGG